MTECDGTPVPKEIFVGDTLCLSVPIPARTQLPFRVLDVESLNITLSGVPYAEVDPDDAIVRQPTSSMGGFMRRPGAVDFNFTFTSPPDEALNTSVRLEAAAALAPLSRFEYEIVWYEFEATWPTFPGIAEAVTIRKGEDNGDSPAEILNSLEDLTDANIAAFPCTQFVVEVFCDEYNIS